MAYRVVRKRSAGKISAFAGRDVFRLRGPVPLLVACRKGPSSADRESDRLHGPGTGREPVRLEDPLMPSSNPSSVLIRFVLKRHQTSRHSLAFPVIFCFVFDFFFLSDLIIFFGIVPAGFSYCTGRLFGLIIGPVERDCLAEPAGDRARSGSTGQYPGR